MKNLKIAISKLIKSQYKRPKYDPKRIVSYSLKNYKDTYRLLEAYDRGDKEAAKILAGSAIVQRTF